MPTWDDRIDEAARQLTDGQPGPGFRARVLARLDERPRRWSRAWLLAPAAAIAILVLAIVMPREPEDTKVGLKADSTPVAEVGLKADTASAPSPPPAEVRLKPDAPTKTRAADGPAVRLTAPAGIDVDVPFASELAPAPIEVTPLVVAAPGLEDLAAVTPLAIEEITIQTIDFAQ